DLSYMAVRCPGLKDEGAWGRGRRGFYTKTQRVARAGSDVGRRTQQPGWGDNGASVVPIPTRAPCSALPRAILASDVGRQTPSFTLQSSPNPQHSFESPWPNTSIR